MSCVEVVGVATRPLPHDEIVGFSLDHPSSGDTFDVFGLQLRGWFLPRSPSTQLRLTIPGGADETLTADAARPDVAEKNPGLPGAARCGFESAHSIIPFPSEFEIGITAVPREGDPIWLASVRCQRVALPQVETTRFNPLMLTTLGRTGGTWVMHLLSRHPEIAAMRPFEYESRIGAYWIDIFATLSEPNSYFQCLGTGQAVGHDWWLGDRSSAATLGWMLRSENLSNPADRAYAEWFGRENLKELLTFFLERVDRSYSVVVGDDTRSRFFVERYEPGSRAQSIMHEVFPNAREIVLVRDPRDMLASILAFGKRRDRELFGRDAFRSDEEYARSDFFGRWVRSVLNARASRPDTSYLLRYEDLVMAPTETLKSLLSYIGVSNSRDVVEAMLRNAELAVTTPQQVHQTSSSTKASIGRWKRDLSDSLQRACAEVLADVLTELGYQSAADHPQVSSV